MEMRFIRPLLGTGRTPKLLCEKGKEQSRSEGGSQIKSPETMSPKGGAQEAQVEAM